jgi:pyruvate/2-oxoglutarate dehydrogenase complex dihydrolipoamide acyltransferase (E2) component
MIEVRMPQLGEGVTEGTIVRWLKAEGDTVAEGETLAEIMTDKVNVEFASPAAGIVRKLHFPEEDVVKVGTVIALVERRASSSVFDP